MKVSFLKMYLCQLPWDVGTVKMACVFSIICYQGGSDYSLGEANALPPKEPKPRVWGADLLLQDFKMSPPYLNQWEESRLIFKAL